MQGDRELNDNAGWCWFQDPRTIIDRETGAVVCASVGSCDGPDGSERKGDVDVASMVWPDGRPQRATLAKLLERGNGDDHDCPALWQRPDGRYLAVYTGHNHGNGGGWSSGAGEDTAPLTFHRVSSRPHDVSEWQAERLFAWPSDDPVGAGMKGVTYSNLLHLSAEGGEKGRLYNIARASGQVWRIATSDDWGETWTCRGPLTLPPAGGRAYSNGYMKFAGNGVDRIDFVTTEAHPRDYNTGVYHGYIQGGKTYDSFGRLVGPDLYEEAAPQPEAFTPLFVPSEIAEGAQHHAWTAELRRGPEPELYALFTTRFGVEPYANHRWPAPGDSDHRLWYARFDGSSWSTQELSKMGAGLNWWQEDYTGLGTVDPRDGLSVYVSTPFDPRSGERAGHYELWRARRPCHGSAWAWTPLTPGADVDHLRPQLVLLDERRPLLAWLRGVYSHPHTYRQSLMLAEAD